VGWDINDGCQRHCYSAEHAPLPPPAPAPCDATEISATYAIAFGAQERVMPASTIVYKESVDKVEEKVAAGR